MKTRANGVTKKKYRATLLESPKKQIVASLGVLYESNKKSLGEKEVLFNLILVYPLVGLSPLCDVPGRYMYVYIHVSWVGIG